MYYLLTHNHSHGNKNNHNDDKLVDVENEVESENAPESAWLRKNFSVLSERAAQTEPNLQEHHVSQHTEDSIKSYKFLEGYYGQGTLCSPEENQSLSSLSIQVLEFPWFNHTRRIP